MKADTAAAVVEVLGPIQERYREIQADPGAVDRILRAGADKAAAIAEVTMGKVREAVGLVPPPTDRQSSSQDLRTGGVERHRPLGPRACGAQGHATVKGSLPASSRRSPPIDGCSR